MKKLMTMIAAVAMAFGLYADGLKNTVGFEDGAYTAGSTIDVTKDDSGAEVSSAEAVWSATDPAETGTVTAYDEDAYDYGTQPVIVTDGPGRQYLALETQGLFRNITAGGAASALADGDVFFDTLVKLSATDGLAVPELTDDAKIAIWAGTDEDNAPGVTNLIVTAAAGATGMAAPEATNFTIAVGSEFDFNAWHRITVRSLVANTDTAKVAGFVVFVDGVQVACSDDDYADKLGKGLALTTEATKFAAQKQLFIGLVYGSDAAKVYALGFKGTGAADDISITDATYAPQFAKGEKVFTLTWDKDAFDSITAGGESLTVEDGTADITLPGATMELAVSGVAKTGYKLIGLTAKEGCTADNENGKFTGIVGTAAGSIDAKKIYFTVNGVECTTLTEAFAEAAKTAGSTITLAGNYSVEKEEQRIAEGADITLDLAGKNMEFTALETQGDVFDVKADAKLTIIDSVGGGEISISGQEDAKDIVIAYAEGTLVIGGDTDKGASFTGKLCDPDTPNLTITGGNFDKVNNGADAFAYTIDIKNYEAVDTVKSGYWTVREKTEPQQEFGGGSGTDVDPYIISNAEHLVELQTKVADGDTFAGKFFQQTEEITVTNWTGIGTVDSKAFSGVYNGNGQTLNVSYAGKSNYGGFFNYLTNGAVISNLTFEALLGTEPNDGEFGFAAVAGMAVASTIADITVNGTIGTAAKPLSHNAAGVVVRADGGTTIKDCVNNASVFGAYTKMGGFVAIVNGGGTVTFENCVNNGAITAKTIDNGKTAGADGLSGILGYTQSNAAIVLNNCENKGTLTGVTGSTIGTIVGKVQNGSVTATGCKAQADVASFGAIVTAGTSVTGLSFATVDGGVATFVADTALALDGEYKVMAANAAPTFEFTEAGTIAFNTNMFFVADYTGITVDDDTKWVLTPAENAGIVTFTCTAKPTDPIPPVDPEAEPSAVSNEIDKVSYVDKAAIQAVIGGDAQKYNDFAAWAKTVDGGQAAVIASSYAAKSFQLAPFVDGNVLFTDEPTLTTTAIAADTETAGNWTFTVKLTDGAEGKLVELLESIANCAKVSTNLETWDAATATAEINDGIATIKITPPEETDKAFMKVEVK